MCFLWADFWYPNSSSRGGGAASVPTLQKHPERQIPQEAFQPSPQVLSLAGLYQFCSKQICKFIPNLCNHNCSYLFLKQSPKLCKCRPHTPRMHPDSLYEQQHWWLGRVHQDLQCEDKYLEQRVLEQTRCQIKRQQNTKSLTNSCLRQAMVSTKEVTGFITYVLKGKWAQLVKVIWSTYTKKQAPSTWQPFSP